MQARSTRPDPVVLITMPAEIRRERLAVAVVIAGSLAAVIAAAAHQGSTRADLKEDGVIETVPARAKDPTLAEMARRSRALHQAGPDRIDTRLARLAIETARQRSDPRYLGRAEAALGPAWQAKLTAGSHLHAAAGSSAAAFFSPSP